MKLNYGWVVVLVLPALSVTDTAIVSAIILSFGGQMTGTLAVTFAIAGAVRSTTGVFVSPA